MTGEPHHVDTTAKLVVMINQISRNLVHDKDPAKTIAEHIRAFWTVRMIRQLADHGPDGLDPLALAAVARLTSPANHGG